MTVQNCTKILISLNSSIVISPVMGVARGDRGRQDLPLYVENFNKKVVFFGSSGKKQISPLPALL